MIYLSAALVVWGVLAFIAFMRWMNGVSLTASTEELLSSQAAHLARLIERVQAIEKINVTEVQADVERIKLALRGRGLLTIHSNTGGEKR